MEDLDRITKEDVIEAHQFMLQSKKALVLVGDYENEDAIVELLAEKLDFMKSYENKDEIEDIFEYKYDDETLNKLFSNEICYYAVK